MHTYHVLNCYIVIKSRCLETASLEWKDVPCTNPQRSPMKKNACGMVAFKDGVDDYLFICGGAGMMCSANEPEAIYIPWKENPDYGWTNEMHAFSLKTGNSSIHSSIYLFVNSSVYLSIYL